jgi:hypothetical protein
MIGTVETQAVKNLGEGCVQAEDAEKAETGAWGGRTGVRP